VRAVIQRRLSMVSPAAQALAQTAAVIGREFTFDVLSRASGQDEAGVVLGLDELWRRQLVREQGVDAYDFSHDKIRAATYDGVSPMCRRSLHLSVAAAIETLHGGDLDPVSGQIAVHYELAGRLQQAIGFYRRAATAAQRIYANAEAVQIYRHLLEGVLRSGLSLAERCDLMLALGEVWRVTGQWAGAEAINREALQAAEVLDDVVLQARAQCALADVLRLQGHYDSALAWLAKAQDGFERADHQAGLSRTLWTMGEIYWYQGDNERALTALNRQLDISTQIGDQRGACEALGTLGMIHWSQGDLDQSQDYCERSIALAKAIGHRQALGHAANILGNIGSARHSYDFAFKWGQIFYEIVREVGDRQGLAWALNSFAVDLNRQGDFQRALAYDVLVLPILSEIGDKWSMSIGIHNLGRILRWLDDDRHAEELYRLAIRLGSKLGIPGLLADMEHDLTELLLEQHRLDEADAVFREAQASAVSVKANQLGGNDVHFNLSVLGVRLRHAQGRLTQSQAVAEFERLLSIWISPEQQAELHWRAWQTDSSLESHRLAAAKQLCALATSTSAILFRQRYHELTGEWLPAPVLPPDLPDVVLQIPVNVESLMAEVRATAAGLLAHSS
jgi:tetratricopeptide (TPR) repeat protein